MSKCTGQNSPDGRHKWTVSGTALRVGRRTVSARSKAGSECEIPRQVEQSGVVPRHVCEYCGEDRYKYLNVNI